MAAPLHRRPYSQLRSGRRSRTEDVESPQSKSFRSDTQARLCARQSVHFQKFPLQYELTGSEAEHAHATMGQNCSLGARALTLGDLSSAVGLALVGRDLVWFSHSAHEDGSPVVERNLR